MKHIMRQVANKNSYTLGFDIPKAIFCFLAEAHLEIDTNQHYI